MIRVSARPQHTYTGRPSWLLRIREEEPMKSDRPQTPYARGKKEGLLEGRREGYIDGYEAGREERPGLPTLAAGFALGAVVTALLFWWFLPASVRAVRWATGG